MPFDKARTVVATLSVKCEDWHVTIGDVKHALRTSKMSAPGPISIQYEDIVKLSDTDMEVLCIPIHQQYSKGCHPRRLVVQLLGTAANTWKGCITDKWVQDDCHAEHH